MKFKYTSKTRLGITRHRWQLKGRNGLIVDASTQSFCSKQAARNNARLTRDGLIEAEL